MKNFHPIRMLMCFALTIFLFSCTKESAVIDIGPDKPDKALPYDSLPQWVQTQITALPSEQPFENDFAQILNPGDLERVVCEVSATLKYYGRNIEDQTIIKLLEGVSADEKARIKAEFFYETISEIRTADMIRTRTKFNNATFNYSTFSIYFEILTNLNTVLPDGTLNSLDYHTTGMSAGKWTFADLVRAGQALGNQNSLNLTDFDPYAMDFHYYEGTGDPIYYSGWYYEMVYEGDITVNGVTNSGPFGTQDGSNVNYIYMNPTVANESFLDPGDGNLSPQFPLYDFVLYIPIAGLDPVYILGSDLL